MQTLCDPHHTLCDTESQRWIVDYACEAAEAQGLHGHHERIHAACSGLVSLVAETLKSALGTRATQEPLSSVQNASLLAFGQMEALRQQALGLSASESATLVQSVAQGVTARLEEMPIDMALQDRCAALVELCLERILAGMRRAGLNGTPENHAGAAPRPPAQSPSFLYLLDNIETPAAVLRANGALERANPAGRALLESLARDCSRTLYTLRAGSELPLIGAEIRSFLSLGAAEHVFERVVYGATRRIIRVRLKRLSNPAEAWHGALAEIREIAEPSHHDPSASPAARAIHDREERFRKLLEAVTSYVYSVHLDSDGVSETTHGPGCLAVTGYAPEDFVSNPRLWIDMVHPEDRDNVLAHVAQFLNDRRLPPLEHRIVHRGGAIRWVRDTLVAYRDESGRLIRYDGLIQDITERKLAEDALRENEEKYRLLFSSETDSIMLMELDTSGFIEVNEAAQRLYGYTRDEFLAMRVEDISAEPEATRQAVKQLHETGKGYSALRLHKKKDGSTFLVEATMTSLALRGRRVACGISRDISGRVKAEEALQRLATAVEQVAEAVVITTPNGVIQYVNSAFESITGYTRAEALGQTSRLLNSGRHEAGFFKELWDTIRSGKTWKGRITNRRKDGSLFEEEATISPVMDTRGEILNYVAVKRDVTREVQMEKQFRQTQKMEAIGTLAGGIAHDFNNILAAIMGFGELAKTQLTGDDLPSQCVNEVLTAARRAKDLVRQILTFTRQVDEQRTPVALGTLLNEALRLMRATLPATTRIEVCDNAPNSVALADTTQIHQVIINLCTNACHAMSQNGGTLAVMLDAVEITPDNAIEDLHTGPYLCVTVSDTGHGMNHATMERIFDPFFTTKSVGEGTGLGLATALGIIKSHGGTITVESEMGRGSTFRVYLPRWTGADRSEIQTTPETPRGQGQRILFVDDEDQIVRPLREILIRIGYRVTGRTSSVEAWELFSARPDDFDLVLTDQTMPNMTGLELARKIQGLRPAIPIILATGYGDSATVERAKALGVVDIVLKPMLITDLARALNTAFEAPVPAPVEKDAPTLL